MKKLGSKLLGLTMATSMVLLAACGAQGGNSAPTTSAPAAGEASSGEQASGEPIKLGFILSTTGNFAFMGQGLKNGIELYFEENGYKIGDRPVEVFFEDDAGDPQKALRSYKQLVLNEEVDMVAGGTIGSVAYALRDEAENDPQVPIINLVGTGDDLSWDKKSDYMFRIGFAAWQYASTQAEHLAKNDGKTAVVIASDYVAGHQIATNFIANYEQHGGKVLDVIWAKTGTSDFSSYLTQISKSNPEVLFMFAPGADGARLIQQYKEFGLQSKMKLADGSAVLNLPSTIEAAGDAVIGGQVVTHYFPGLENELNKSFYKNYTEKYQKNPDTYSLNGYDTAQMMAKVIKEAKSDSLEDRIEVLKGAMTFESPRGPVKIDPKTNNPVQNVYVLEGVKENDKIDFKLVQTYENVTMPESNPGYKPYP